VVITAHLLPEYEERGVRS